MDTALFEAVRRFAADTRFRAEFKDDPATALHRRGIRLGDEDLIALVEMSTETAYEPMDGEGRVKGGGWFKYRELTPSLLGTP